MDRAEVYRNLTFFRDGDLDGSDPEVIATFADFLEGHIEEFLTAAVDHLTAPPRIPRRAWQTIVFCLEEELALAQEDPDHNVRWIARLRQALAAMERAEVF